ncbi:type I-B CRISPR-associated protein Cas5b [[Clostridium] dakarense]|uniref:type I-B CRISPR-associated protein Cas5b n=1 Tax=Faecalimicrobium dakarense TaxID=1301100 RepID=UPI0004B7E620|nr:type I-B CRISPR-associated protein Cas5b [[Clostridium] dakarense]
MKALKFNLSGKTAFFKKPEVNTYLYFTYGTIHKVALMGIIGSCLGLGGYNQQNKEDDYPEFYEKLKDLKFAIVPKNEGGYINKKVQVFNNSVGYASKEEGGNLIVKEQWLENPAWDIYILLDNSDICKNIEKRFSERKFIYIPYLGKNDHVANIIDVQVIEDIKEVSDFNKLDSIFVKEEFEFIKDDGFDDFDFGDLDKEVEFKYQEKLPYKLELSTNQYILKTFIYTNMKVAKITDSKVYSVDNLNLYFI